MNQSATRPTLLLEYLVYLILCSDMFVFFFQTVQRFAIVDLSNFYFDVAKDRLYVGYAFLNLLDYTISLHIIVDVKVWSH